MVVAAEASVRYAARVICHDRDLPDRDASNPDADHQLVEMDDRQLELESEALVRRYEISTDHDQDQVRAWQLFDPALIGWLADRAPEDFSFELQDGALCGFVPGPSPDRGARRAVRGDRDRPHARLGDRRGDGRRAGGRGQPRRHGRARARRAPFARPPRSARAAALHFGLPLIGHSSRRLGAEAFFRSHAAALGLERMEPGEFKAAHIDIAVPGAITQVARGRLPDTDVEGYLVFTTDDSAGSGWAVVVADIREDDNGFAFAGTDFDREAEKHGLDISSNGNTITIWRPDGSPSHRPPASSTTSSSTRARPWRPPCTRPGTARVGRRCRRKLRLRSGAELPRASRRPAASSEPCRPR